MSFHFANPSAFQLLGLAGLVFVFAFWRMSRGRALLEKTFGASRVAFLAASVSWTKRRWKVILECFALAMMVVALARPQSGESRAKAKSEGLEVVFAVDVSNSMLAEDVKPSRLELTKQEISRMISQLTGDKVGLVAFAGSAVVLSPLTTDKAALRMYIDSLGPTSVQNQGTDFYKALSESWAALKRGGLENDNEQAVTKVIVLISDGENHGQRDIDIAQQIAKEGIRIYSVVVGTEKGAPIPLHNEHGEMVGYKKSRDGQVILTQSTGKSLEKIAQAGGGTSRNLAFGGSTVSALMKDFDQLQKTSFDSTEVTNYDENYQAILFWGVLFALIELFLGERKGEGRVWRGRFEALRR